MEMWSISSERLFQGPTHTEVLPCSTEGGRFEGMDPYRFLPSERTATTIEEFLEGCRAEPALAADQLHQGYFEPWLRDAGRPDLADAAAQVRQTDVAPAPALEQFLQTATRTPLRRRRPSSPARVHATAGRPPTHEEALKDAAPTEATSSPAADLPSITRLAPEEARRAFPAAAQAHRRAGA